MRLFAIGLAMLVIGWTALSPSQAQDRVALVIGNDRYTNLPTDRQLTKAVNDARAIGATLEKLGFKVFRGENLTRAQMVDQVFSFTQAIKPGDTAVMFFAGHGVSFSGGNYLLPTDIPMPRQGEETRARNSALGEADIIADVQERKARVMVMVLDACRDNPFRQAGLTRSIGSEAGLGRGKEAEGVFSIYSAGFGQTALDRLGDSDKSPNSVFTRALIPALARTDTHLADIVIDMREEVSRVAATIGHQQYPAYYDQTRGGRIFLTTRTANAPAAEVRPQRPEILASSAPAPERKPLRSNRKVALLIGIDKYEQTTPLKNAVSDVTAVGEMLRAAKFDTVRIETNLRKDLLQKAVQEFNTLAEGSDTAVIYFAGQSARLANTRLVFAADSKPTSSFDAAIEGMDIDLFQAAIPSSARVRLIVIDGCQKDVFDQANKAEPAQPSTRNAAIVFSSGIHEDSYDGTGTLSPFAASFTKHFRAPNRRIRDAFNLVRDDVARGTQNKQNPVLYGYVPSDLSLLGR